MDEAKTGAILLIFLAKQVFAALAYAKEIVKMIKDFAPSSLLHQYIGQPLHIIVEQVETKLLGKRKDVLKYLIWYGMVEVHRHRSPAIEP